MLGMRLLVPSDGARFPSLFMLAVFPRTACMPTSPPSSICIIAYYDARWESWCRKQRFRDKWGWNSRRWFIAALTTMIRWWWGEGIDLRSQAFAASSPGRWWWGEGIDLRSQAFAASSPGRWWWGEGVDLRSQAFGGSSAGRWWGGEGLGLGGRAVGGSWAGRMGRRERYELGG